MPVIASNVPQNPTTRHIFRTAVCKTGALYPKQVGTNCLYLLESRASYMYVGIHGRADQHLSHAITKAGD
jgi:hypothetical protein